MERKLCEFFDGETMPDECVRQIASELIPKTVPTLRRTRPVRRILTTAAILMCLSILSVSGIGLIREGGNLPTESIRLSTRNAYHMLFGLDTRSREEREADEAIDREMEVLQMYAVPTPEPYAEVRDGRLYFIACGENIDITDQCSDDHVFLYTYTDDRGYVHYLGVGGTHDAWGIMEVYQHPDYSHLPSLGWCGAHGEGYFYDENGDDLGWKVEFRALTGHPYP